MQHITNRLITLFFVLAAGIYIALAIVGGIQNYSPVPVGDMWDGYLNSYFNLQDGHYGAWWEQHNEHRIPIAKLFFWISVRLFGGAPWLLIAINYILVACIAYVFCLFLKEYVKKPAHHFPAKIIGLFLLAWVFSWSQSDNFVWGFQNQFFTAQLLPLAAFYFLFKSTQEKLANKSFIIACVCGVLSCGTMANGVLALPLLTLYALLMRQSKQRIVILAILSVVMSFLFFYGFSKPGHHSSLLQSILHQPKDMLKYILLYLGNPFRDMVRRSPCEHSIVSLAGLILILNAFYFGAKNFFAKTKSPLTFALLFFLLYIGGTALGTAGGRVIFGIDQALSGRYNTPALMAWATLVLLYVPYLLKSYRRYGNRVFIPFMLIIVLMWHFEWSATKNKRDLNYKKNIALLAVKLRVNDDKTVDPIYPHASSVFSRVEEAEKRHFPIQGMAPFENAYAELGKIENQTLSHEFCNGNIETTEKIINENTFIKIHGYLFNFNNKKSDVLVKLVDKQKRIVGFILTGGPRSHEAKKIDGHAKQVGFEGYVYANKTNEMLTAVYGDSSCVFKHKLPLISGDKI